MQRSKGYKICAVIALCTACLIPQRAPTQRAAVSAMPASIIKDENVKVSSRLWELFFENKAEEASEDEEIFLIPGGGVFGARIKRAHPSVEDAGAVKGLEAGDVILTANSKEICSGKDLRNVIAASKGEDIALTLLRGQKRLQLKVTPSTDGDNYTIGITLREGAAGIGTVTYIDPENGEFGGLGHGICDAESKCPIELSEGEVTGVILGGVQKGEAGKPGELSGILTDKCLGEVYSNTECGVFGKLSSPKLTCESAIPIGKSSTVHEGDATILSTVKNGRKMEYSVRIFDIERDTGGTKCFKIKVTDPTLIALTGGIVKGMSGSPIIQDGKLVGAVTHVLVANPTEGYGIFIENMLAASNAAVQPKAA